MDGRSVNDRLDSKSAGWFDRPTDRPENKQTSRQANHAPTIHPTNRPIAANKTTSQPTIRLACYKSNHRHPIYPTDRKPTNQAPVSGFDIPHFCQAGCTAVYLQTIYKRRTIVPSHLRLIRTSPSDSHLNPLSNHPISEVGCLTIYWTSYGHCSPRTSRGIHVYTNPRFDGHLWQYLGTPPMADLLYRVINPYILMLYTAYSPPQTKFVAVMGWDRDLVIPLNSVNTQWHI